MCRVTVALLGLLAIFCFAQAAEAAAPGLLSREHHIGLLQAAKANPLQHFQEWLSKHAKPYASDAAEAAKRFKVWMENLEWALEYNARQTSHWVGMTSLADLTHEEYKARYLGFDKQAQQRLRADRRASNAMPRFSYADVDPAALPRSVDWRTEGAVTEVKNQQQCGSCWAFSATGAVEGVNAIFTKQLISLSEQELVDCDREKDNGCHGGLMDYAFQWIIKNKGIDTEEHYPYEAVDGVCKEHHRKHRVVTIDGYEDVPENDEVSLKKAVAHQPVAVAIEADQKAFQLYVGGVFTDETCGTELDHGVLVVGYGAENGQDYWIVKNSWGAEWGDKGYIRLAANIRAREGMCGIAMAASYPTKTTPNPPAPGPEPGPAPGPSPKPPKPAPVQCDRTSECPAATTCCCVTQYFGMCFQWGCCPIVDAVCCDDGAHCCPPDLPVCDTKGGRCLPGAGQIGTPVPWLTKTPAARNFHILDELFMRGGAKEGRKYKCPRMQQQMEEELVEQQQEKKKSVLVVA